MAPAVASSAMPAMRIRPDRKNVSITASTLQLAGVQGQRDGADDEVKQDSFAADQALDEIREMQGERQIAEQAAQRVGSLEILQMPDEPEAEQNRNGDQCSDDLVLRQSGKELTHCNAGHSQQNETDITGHNSRSLGISEKIQRHQIDERAGRHQQQDRDRAEKLA